jgi:cation diffusion facilitator CzcD-associated flavoprotein CzcO
MPSLPTAAVIGAGSSGIAAAKALHERGVPFSCFEASDRVGGNWVFGNKNGMSAAYRQLFINTSRDRMEYSDYPMPKSYPDFPHHTQIAAYFDAYVEHFASYRGAPVFAVDAEAFNPIAREGDLTGLIADLGRFDGPRGSLVSGRQASID